MSKLQEMEQRFNEEDFELGSTEDGDAISINEPKLKQFIKQEILTALEAMKEAVIPRELSDDEFVRKDLIIGANQCRQEVINRAEKFISEFK